MVNVRRIKFSSVKDMLGVKEVISGASTWGELKSEQPEIASGAIGMKAYIRTGAGTTITGDHHRLPEGDFDFVFVADKNDSGRSSN